MRTVLWLVGEPGAGKTTLARRFIEPGSKIVPKPKWTVGQRVVAAGHYIGKPFDGADTVPYTGAQEALLFWRERLMVNAELTILDGDRFSARASVAFFESVEGVELRRCCIHLALPVEEGARRRVERGTNQNANWVKGRITKARRFADGFADRLELDAMVQPGVLYERARAFLEGA